LDPSRTPCSSRLLKKSLKILQGTLRPLFCKALLNLANEWLPAGYTFDHARQQQEKTVDSQHSSALQPWQVESSEEIENYRIFTLKREQVRSPSSGKQGTFYILDAPDWVSIVPVTDDGQVVFVVQYRHGSHRLSLETPAGQLEPGEAVEAAAARELREETGYVARSYTRLGSTFANSAFMTNRFTAVLAEGVRLTDPTAWDEHEELELRLIPAEQIPALLSEGVIENTSANMALSWYLLHRHGILPAPQAPA
jgi:ADP-ribose pyrophosphatase